MKKAMCGNCIHFIEDYRKRHEKIGVCEVTGYYRSKTSRACKADFSTMFNAFNKCPITRNSKCCNMNYACMVKQREKIATNIKDRIMRTFLGGNE